MGVFHCLPAAMLAMLIVILCMSLTPPLNPMLKTLHFSAGSLQIERTLLFRARMAGVTWRVIIEISLAHFPACWPASLTAHSTVDMVYTIAVNQHVLVGQRLEKVVISYMNKFHIGCFLMQKLLPEAIALTLCPPFPPWK